MSDIQKEEVLDEEWQEQAIAACKDLGLTEDEAERAVEDYIDLY